MRYWNALLVEGVALMIPLAFLRSHSAEQLHCVCALCLPDYRLPPAITPDTGATSPRSFAGSNSPYPTRLL